MNLVTTSWLKQRLYQLLIFFPLSITSVNAFAWELQTLMSELAATPRPAVSFIESRESEMLLTPIISRGTLSLSANGVMVKETETPEKSRLVVDDQNVTFIRNNATEQASALNLNEQPWLRSFIAGFRALLLGDIHTLQQHYRIRLDGTADNWHLSLIPMESQLLQYIDDIEAHGSGGYIKKFIVAERGGDTVTLDIGEELP